MQTSGRHRLLLSGPSRLNSLGPLGCLVWALRPGLCLGLILNLVLCASGPERIFASFPHDMANFIAGRPMTTTILSQTTTTTNPTTTKNPTTTTNPTTTEMTTTEIDKKNPTTGKPPLAAKTAATTQQKNTKNDTTTTTTATIPKKTPFTTAAQIAAASHKNNAVGNSILPYTPGPVPYDPDAAKTWIFPTSALYEKRHYQYEIAQIALSHNTLVSLPTGLGKTLIAAVVLYNYYRWFPTGKILFLAPTVPLVDQQLMACYHVMGIPTADTAIVTGQVTANQRALLYQSRRVFLVHPKQYKKIWKVVDCPRHTPNRLCALFWTKRIKRLVIMPIAKWSNI